MVDLSEIAKNLGESIFYPIHKGETGGCHGDGLTKNVC